MVTYDICRKSSSKSPRLLSLIRDIRLFELQLGCSLEVIHVPGAVMIMQGSDGLSRGMLPSRLSIRSSVDLLRELFRPAVPSDALLSWMFEAVNVLPLPRDPDLWSFHTDTSTWSSEMLLLGNHCWCVSPFIGRQAIITALQHWIEFPTCSSHVFIIPRLLQRSFGRISKHVQFVGVFSSVPCGFIPLVDFVILYLPYFDRLKNFVSQNHSPFDDDAAVVDTRPKSTPRWIKQQLTNLRGLA